MTIRTIAAALALACLASGARAEDCRLKLVAALDAVVTDKGVMVPVTLGGQAGGYFMLDFGALVSGVADTASDAMHLKRDFIASNLSIDIAGKHLREEARVPVQIGAVKGDIVMGVVPGFSPDDKRETGILGIDLLGRFDVELDLAHGKVNLFSQDHCKGQVIYWTHTAAVAAVAMKFRGQETFVIPMQLDGQDLDAMVSTGPLPLLNGRVAQRTFGLEFEFSSAPGSALPKHIFKTLSVDGLTITNPELSIYEDNSAPCNGGARMKAVPLRTEHNAEFETCFGLPDLTIGLPELKHLRVFIAFKERMLYATAADAG